jgi:glucosamine kinase
MSNTSERGVVIGIDGGGSTTRALCVRLDGTALGYAEAGGANPKHNADAILNVQTAIHRALASASRSSEEVVSLVAGFAGLDQPSDQEWAAKYTSIQGITPERVHLNDADVAHAGAFGTGPGVIAIAGTGSGIVAITEAGQRLENDLFHHYAGGARHMAFHAMQRLLIGAAGAADAAFVGATLRYWGEADLASLRAHMVGLAAADYRDVKRLFGGMAPIVTSAAEHGSPLAQAICAAAADGLATGIRLLGGCFSGSEVRAALIGGLARSAPIARRVAAILAEPAHPRYLLLDPAIPPIGGAALLALARAGIPIDAALTARLAATLAVLMH